MTTLKDNWTIHANTLRQLWSREEKIDLDSTEYRVGRMSYGDYFLEPLPETAETAPFNRGTLWLERIPKTNIYQISYEL